MEEVLCQNEEEGKDVDEEEEEEKIKKEGYKEMKWLKKCREWFQGFCVKKADEPW